MPTDEKINRQVIANIPARPREGRAFLCLFIFRHQQDARFHFVNLYRYVLHKRAAFLAGQKPVPGRDRLFHIIIFPKKDAVDLVRE
jgi:hypothetical protein